MQFTADFSLPSGRMESISHSDIVKWIGNVKFGKRNKAGEAELIALNRLTASTPVVVYANDGDTSQVYLSRRTASFRGTRTGLNSVQGNTISFEEWI